MNLASDPQPLSGQSHATHDDGANKGFALEPALQAMVRSTVRSF